MTSDARRGDAVTLDEVRRAVAEEGDGWWEANGCEVAQFLLDHLARVEAHRDVLMGQTELIALQRDALWEDRDGLRTDLARVEAEREQFYDAWMKDAARADRLAAAGDALTAAVRTFSAFRIPDAWGDEWDAVMTATHHYQEARR